MDFWRHPANKNVKDYMTKEFRGTFIDKTRDYESYLFAEPVRPRGGKRKAFFPKLTSLTRVK